MLPKIKKCKEYKENEESHRLKTEPSKRYPRSNSFLG